MVKKENAERGFREWLKKSLKDIKRKKYVRKQMKRMEKREKQRDIKEKNRINVRRPIFIKSNL